jgi:hypothetical protein
MRALVGLLARLATRAGANIGRPGQRWERASFVGTATISPRRVRSGRAGRLVPLPEEAPRPDRSLATHWAPLAAVALVVLIVAAGYMRRRWKAYTQGRGPRFPWPAWGRWRGR